ncbi:ribonuclease HI [Candidatus Peregrinibacteria bacterium CG_4_10_14_0_2_um_filter_38_24]|nr:MAG: ribonuclease HI [Candidatus Peregrinibacteria bacterium CG_4_10_14_0_2_um_filter_38_24]
MQKHKIDIYTDGSCIGNPGPGGWGVIILTEDREVQIKGGELDTTNNRMEMSAIINALRWLKNEASIDETNTKDFLIKLHSDSNLLIQTLLQGWKKKANKDLWAELDALHAPLKIEWIWVKAHATNKYNNLVDEIALGEAIKQKRI